MKYSNIPHGFKVMTKQETGIRLKNLLNIKQISSAEYSALYENIGNLQHDDQIEKEQTEINNIGREQMLLKF